MSKYGSSSIGLLVADGYSLLGAKPKEITGEIEAVQDDTTGLGDAWPEVTPTGMQMTKLSIGEAFFDDGTGNMHETLRASQGTSRIVTYALAGDTIGQPFVGHAGAFGLKYRVMAKNGNLTKASAEYLCSGARDEGVILQNLATKTADWDTEASSVDDNGAGTSSGGVGYLQVTAFSGFSGFIATIQDSADDITYASLVAFSDVTSGPTAQRVTVSGAVDRYLSIDGNVTGTGSVTCWVGFSRTPD